LTDQERLEHLRQHFRATFDAEPDFIARAPGRINLIGEHTDYNGGFVLPVAIDRTVLIAVKSLPGTHRVDMSSLNYNNSTSFDLDNIQPTEEKDLHWSNYVRAVAWALSEKGLIDLSALSGAKLAIEGNVPLASGLSSSAAIEVASALAFIRLANRKADGPTLALACQWAENKFIGVNSGIMDQFISALGEPDSALMIDTRSLAFEIIPLRLEELGYKIVAVDSAAPRTLAGTAYNQRRKECEEAVRILAAHLGLGSNVQLRDITRAQLDANATLLSDSLYRRARHVITENDRTLSAVGLMRQGLEHSENLHRLGLLLYESHRSLQYDYEVSSPELDLLVDLAQSAPGVVGARMTGAGFGGCTVNIVSAQYLPEFEKIVVDEYKRRTGRNGSIYICRAVEGGSYLNSPK
jgi:galactokinase